MKTGNIIIKLLLGILLVEILYYNLAFDILLLCILFLTGLSMGRFIPVRLKFLDNCIVRFSLGLGITGFLIWISTFHNYNYQSLYLIFSFLVIIINYKYLIKVFHRLKKFIFRINEKNKLFFPLILIFLMFYLMVASYPIFQHDSLTKHIAIPTKIINSSHWDYNSVECMYFNESSVLPYMYYSYLLALGGSKAVVLFNTFLSFFILLILVRITMFIRRSVFAANAVLLIYLTTPLFYIKSTILYVDIPPQFFIFAALLIICYLNIRTITYHIYIISFLLGLAYFAKQTAIFFIIPIGIIIGFILFQSFFRKKISLLILLLKSIGSLLFLTLPFLPALLISFYKTGVPLIIIKKIIIYFFVLFLFFISLALISRLKKMSVRNIKKIRIFLSITCLSWLLYFIPTMFITLLKTSYPWKKGFRGIRYEPLGLDPGSLLSMVFQSSKNSSFPDGLLGVFLLLFFITPFLLFYQFKIKSKKSKTFAFIFFLTLFSYFVSIQFRYNLRWLLGSFILAVPVSAYTLGYMFDFIRNIKLKNLLLNIFLVGIILPGLMFIFYPKDVYTFWGFKKEMIIPNEKLTLNANESVLCDINHKGVKVLSNNDVYRGTFLGEFYTLTFINRFITDKIKSGEISPQILLQSFDYYLFDKRKPETPYLPKGTFSLSNPDIKYSLKLVKESQSHLLYKVVEPELDSQILLSEIYDPPISVTVQNNKTKNISTDFSFYRIEIEAKRKDEGHYWGRWQINWADENGKFISTSLIPFQLVEKQKMYSSPKMKKPAKARKGILYITSHDSNPIIIHSVKLMAWKKKKGDLIEEELKKFNERWPHLAKQISKKEFF